MVKFVLDDDQLGHGLLHHDFCFKSDLKYEQSYETRSEII
jgi:hypothetical protein